jgi:hypothetical protein
VRFKNTEFEDEPFMRRLEYIIESALEVVGLERKDAFVLEEDISESD